MEETGKKVVTEEIKDQRSKRGWAEDRRKNGREERRKNGREERGKSWREERRESWSVNNSGIIDNPTAKLRIINFKKIYSCLF